MSETIMLVKFNKEDVESHADLDDGVINWNEETEADATILKRFIDETNLLTLLDWNCGLEESEYARIISQETFMDIVNDVALSRIVEFREKVFMELNVVLDNVDFEKEWLVFRLTE